jgi:hypothetical protein
MDKEVFKTINVGVCSYFFMIYSCLQFVLKFWYASYPFNTLTYFSFGIIILMLLFGIFSFSRYRGSLNNFSENSKLIAVKAVNLIVGFIFLAIILQITILDIILSIGQINLIISQEFLIYFLNYIPFIIFAVVKIIKGSRVSVDPLVSDAIAYLCFLVVLCYVLVSCIYRLLVWISTVILVYPDFTYMSSFEMRGILIQILFIAAGSILLFIPFRFKKNAKSNIDSQSREKLKYLSFVVGGCLILINGLIETFDFLISNLMYVANRDIIEREPVLQVPVFSYSLISYNGFRYSILFFFI